MENYEKKYKEVLRKASKIHRDDNEEIKHYMEVLFPELQDEDEKIRKAILGYLTKMWGNSRDDVCGVHVEDAITWLEKQGKISTKSVHIADIPFGAKDSELFEESITIPDGCYAYIDGDKVIIKRHNDEKVNSANKIEPKFHKGDWIIDKESKEVFYISKNLANTYEIVDIEGNDYHVPHYILEEDYDVWTIQDAKPGDVLVDVYGNIGIFEKRYGINWHTYCYLGCEGRFISEGGSHGSICYPATKEQRDLLFQKMKEAGYKWDSKKKDIY